MIERNCCRRFVHDMRAGTIRRIFTASLKSLLLVALLCANAQAQTVSHRIDRFLGDWKVKNGPGMAVMLIRDGRVEYRKAFGLADIDTRTRITPETQFLV